MSLRKARYGPRAQGSQARAPVKRSSSNSRFPRRTTQIASRAGYLKPRYGCVRAYPTITSDRFKTTHKYSLAVEIAISSGISTPQVFRGNSIFDPDFTSTGYTCMGYSTLAALYNRYLVTSSSIRIRAASDSPVQVAVVPVLTSSTISTATEDLAENAYGKDMMTAAGTVREMSSSMSTSRMWGQTLTDGSFAAATGANPSNSWFWHIKVGHLFGAGTATVNLIVDIVYYTEWSARVSYSTRT